MPSSLCIGSAVGSLRARAGYGARARGFGWLLTDIDSAASRVLTDIKADLAPRYVRASSRGSSRSLFASAAITQAGQ